MVLSIPLPQITHQKVPALPLLAYNPSIPSSTNHPSATDRALSAHAEEFMEMMLSKMPILPRGRWKTTAEKVQPAAHDSVRAIVQPEPDELLHSPLERDRFDWRHSFRSRPSGPILYGTRCEILRIPKICRIASADRKVRLTQTVHSDWRKHGTRLWSWAMQPVWCNRWGPRSRECGIITKCDIIEFRWESFEVRLFHTFA